MISDESIIKIKDIAVTDLDGEKVMMDMEQGQYFILNKTGAAIWDACKNEISVRDLINTIMNEFNIDIIKCRESIISYLADLKEKGLVKIL